MIGDDELDAAAGDWPECHLDATGVHARGVACVDEQVQDELVQPGPVSDDVRGVVGDVENDGHGVRATGQHGGRSPYLRGETDRTPAPGLVEGDGSQRARERRAAFGFFDDRGEVRRRIAGAFLSVRVSGLRRGDDRREQVVEIVGEAACEASDRLAAFALGARSGLRDALGEIDQRHEEASVPFERRTVSFDAHLGGADPDDDVLHVEGVAVGEQRRDQAQQPRAGAAEDVIDDAARDRPEELAKMRIRVGDAAVSIQDDLGAGGAVESFVEHSRLLPLERDVRWLRGGWPSRRAYRALELLPP